MQFMLTRSFRLVLAGSKRPLHSVPLNQDMAGKQKFPLRFWVLVVYAFPPRLNATSEYGSLFMLGLLGVLIIGLIVGAIAKLIVPARSREAVW